jgi:hypothetical protein
MNNMANWHSSSVGKWAKNYVDYGFSVFPCHGIGLDMQCTCGKVDCPNAGKHPYTRHGVKDASKNLEEIAAMFNYRADLNIAIATGAPSGVFVLDVDVRGEESGEEAVAALERENGALPITLTSITGNGRQLFYAMPDFEVKNATGIVKRVDVRGTGGYVIAAPSTHRVGRQYAFYEPTFDAGIAEAPDWLLQMLKPKLKAAREIVNDYSTGILPEWSHDEVHRMLECISPSVGREEWLNVGFALHAGGYPLSFWDTWSQGGGEKYVPGECEKCWRGFKADNGITMGTLVDAARLGGWHPEPIARPEVDTSPVDDFVETVQHKARGKDSAECKFNFDPLGLTGLIGDTVRAMNKYAMYKQPELYLLNTIAAAGAVFGRKYACPMNARTNVYMVGVARTAGGKDFSRQYISNLFEKAGLTEYLGAHYIRSDTGMLVSVKSAPSQVMMLDEFGMYLEALASAKAPLHIKNVATCLTKLFTSSGTFYDHGATADTKTKIVIQRPNLCIYGTTTEETYASALKRTAIDSGDLNRFLVFKSSRVFTGEEELPPKYEIPADIVDRWEEFSTASRFTIPDIAEIPPAHTTVEWDDKVMAMLRECRIKQNTLINAETPTSGLWGRYAELVTKIAMIFAISDNKNDPRFSEYHVTIARNIVDVCMEYMVGLANGYVSENDYEAQQQKIVKFLRTKRKGASMSELHTRFRSIKARERRDILSDMAAQGVISIESIKTEGRRPKEVVRLA